MNCLPLAAPGPSSFPSQQLWPSPDFLSFVSPGGKTVVDRSSVSLPAPARLLQMATSVSRESLLHLARCRLGLGLSRGGNGLTIVVPCGRHALPPDAKLRSERRCTLTEFIVHLSYGCAVHTRYLDRSPQSSSLQRAIERNNPRQQAKFGVSPLTEWARTCNTQTN